MSSKTKPPTLTVRDIKILKIAQAHVLPGMSLFRWQVILAQHGVPAGSPLDGAPLTTLDAIIADIRAVTQAPGGVA